MFNRAYPYYEQTHVENLPDMVKRKAKEQPEDIAFAWFEGSKKHTITYRAFLEHVCAAAEKIEGLSDRGSHIGIMGVNSYEWLVIFMAVIFSGNVAVVFDKDMKEEELRDTAERMDLAYMLTDPDCGEKARTALANTAVKSFAEVENFAEAKSFAGTKNFENCLCSEPAGKNAEDFRIDDPDAVCCIFLTSGTTGKRKGVMLSHRNIAADINGGCKLFKPSGDTLAVLPFHHAFGLIAAVWMIFNCGLTIFISRGMRRIQKELLLAKPQTMMLVPLFVESFWKQIRMAAKKNVSGVSVKDMFGGNLEYIICGGAPLNEFYVKEYRNFGIELLNGYGTTECSPVAAVNRNHYHRDGTVGLALPGSQVKISDEGEVLICGDYVMTGYYKEPEETKEALKDGWYYTGDLGKIDEDGFITLTGRKKNLIILSSGENIAPEELEEKLIRIDGIDEVIVSSDQNDLVAEIFSKSACDDTKAENTKADDAEADETRADDTKAGGTKAEETKAAIREAIERFNIEMPMYKRITRIVFRSEEFPKTTSQKIKRRPQNA